ncbi:MAG: MazG nucleotide pyrophosphohydrolase domain-containing protein [Patescibacteria group bacterium]
MQFKDIQKGVINNAKKYKKKYKVKIDEDFALLKLMEEVGEFAQAVLIHRRKCRPEKYVDKKVSKAEVSKELADVVGMAMITAQVMGIDLEKAIDQKWITKK